MKKLRTIFLGCSLAWMATFSVASAMQSEEDQMQQIVDDNMHDMTLAPAAESTPVLKFRLFPNRSAMIGRNAATYYSRAAHRSLDVQSRIRANNLDERFDPIAMYDGDSYYDWFESPLDKMPVADMQAFIDMNEEVFFELDRARVSGRCDFGTMPDTTERIDWMNITLTEEQQMRAIVRMLAIKVRLALHKGDFEQATFHLATGFKIAHDLGNGESLVTTLVGIACSGLLAQQVRVMQQQPGAPNLYWPLLDLPKPISNVSVATRSELRHIVNSELSGLIADPENAELTVEGWRELLRSQSKFTLDGMTPLDPSVLNMLIVRSYPVAKQALLESGMDHEKVNSMPAIQVVAIQQKRVTSAIAQKINSAANLPYHQRLARVNEVERAIDAHSFGRVLTSESVLLPSFSFYLPATQQVAHAELRTVRAFDALVTIEAIRAHAAATGSLPNSLEEITVVPVPNNPATNKPFAYTVSDGVAELRDFGFMAHSWHLYKLQIAK